MVVLQLLRIRVQLRLILTRFPSQQPYICIVRLRRGIYLQIDAHTPVSFWLPYLSCSGCGHSQIFFHHDNKAEIWDNWLVMRRVVYPSAPGGSKGVAPWFLEGSEEQPSRFFGGPKEGSSRSLNATLLHPWEISKITMNSYPKCCGWGVMLTVIPIHYPFG